MGEFVREFDVKGQQRLQAVEMEEAAPMKRRDGPELANGSALQHFSRRVKNRNAYQQKNEDFMLAIENIIN